MAPSLKPSVGRARCISTILSITPGCQLSFGTSCLGWTRRRPSAAAAYGSATQIDTAISASTARCSVHIESRKLLFVGPIVDDLHVLHRCDVPLCVHPAHLFLGTEADNHADKAAKGRSARGTRNGAAKISESTVLAILAAAGRHQDVAARFGVAKATVSHIKTGRQWASITGVLPSFRARMPLPILSAFQNIGGQPQDKIPANQTSLGIDPLSADGASSNGDGGS